MENSVSPLWDRTAAPTTPLRRPNSEVNPTKTTSNDVSDILKKTNLNVEAVEFVPRFSPAAPSVQASNGSIQDRLKAYQPTNAFHQDSDKDLNVVKQVIGTLTSNPGQFDDLIGVLMDTLHRYSEDLNFISRMTKILVDHAVADANFRYTSARICEILEAECPLFRSNLHILCENQLTQTRNLHGLTLFFAEIYSKLNSDNLYGNCLINAIFRLLSKKTVDDYKCVCQSLKLSGVSLDDYNKKAMDDVFTQLSVVKSQCPSSICKLIESLITLRSNQWGRQSSPPVSSNHHVDEDLGWMSDGPVFYGPDGQELSREESDFINDTIDEMAEYDSDPDALYNPEDEMTEEVRAGFKEFVEMSKNGAKNFKL